MLYKRREIRILRDARSRASARSASKGYRGSIDTALPNVYRSEPVPSTRRIQSVLLTASLALCGLLVPAHAQYPTKPVKLVVQSAPGGAPDTVARLVADKLTPLLGQPVVIEHRAGSNGNIAMEMVARSTPDGHTLVVVSDSMIVINPHIYTRMPIDVLKDLVPVAPIAEQSNFFLSVHPSVPVKNFQEFVEHARTVSPPMAYASGGHGSQHQMAMEMLKSRAGINLLHVPYKGGAPAAAAALAGEVSAMFSGASTGPQIQAGKLRGLAVTGRKRSPLFPALPTISEYYPGYELTTWIALFAPAGVPDGSLTRLRADINKALAMPDLAKRFNAAGGLEPFITTPQQFSERIRADYDKYSKLVKLIGAKIDN
jgi:tripartite-type tricarboxylate transporter receptor subunit TctC